MARLSMMFTKQKDALNVAKQSVMADIGMAKRVMKNVLLEEFHKQKQIQ